MCANPYSGQRQKTYLCVSTPYPNNNVGACRSNMTMKNTVNHCIPLRTTSNNASSSGNADISRNMARNSCMWPTIQAMQTLATVQLASTAQMQPLPAGMASVNNPDVQHTATSWHVPNDVTTCSSSQHTAGNPAVSAVTGCNADGTAYWWPDWWRLHVLGSLHTAGNLGRLSATTDGHTAMDGSTGGTTGRAWLVLD